MSFAASSVWNAMPCRSVASPVRSFASSVRSFAPRTTTRAARRQSICRAASSRIDIYRWPEWSETWRFLTDSGLQSVDATRAKEMVESGKWILVDVRPTPLYEQSHAEGAISVPLFDNIDWSSATPLAYLRAAAFLVNGVSPVVPNETFNDQIAEAKKNGKGFILYCETGGTMTPTMNFMFGKESRSLKACYRVLEADSECPSAHLDGGLFAWYQQKMPMTGEYDEGNAGRTPNIAEEPELEKKE